MKQALFQRTFTVDESKPDYTFGEYVKKTAQLIGRSYIATFKMVEKWEPGFLASLYDDCITKWKNRGFKSPSHMWWTERKKLKQ
jgi:hypothetical protein